MREKFAGVHVKHLPPSVSFLVIPLLKGPAVTYSL